MQIFCQGHRWRIVGWYVRVHARLALVTLSHIASSDDNLSHLYENSTVLHRYLKWVEGSDSDHITSDMQTCAALSLGNLARTGKCIWYIV